MCRDTHFNTLSLSQPGEHIGEEVEVERVGMIEVVVAVLGLVMLLLVENLKIKQLKELH